MPESVAGSDTMWQLSTFRLRLDPCKVRGGRLHYLVPTNVFLKAALIPRRPDGIARVTLVDDNGSCRVRVAGNLLLDIAAKELRGAWTRLALCHLPESGVVFRDNSLCDPYLFVDFPCGFRSRSMPVWFEGFTLKGTKHA